MSTNTNKIEQPTEQTFQINQARYVSKERNLDFNTYEAYIGPKQHRTTVKFTRAVKNAPEESGNITVETKNMSIDTRGKYPVLWIKEIKAFTPFDQSEDTTKIDKFFGTDNLPF